MYEILLVLPIGYIVIFIYLLYTGIINIFEVILIIFFLIKIIHILQNIAYG